MKCPECKGLRMIHIPAEPGIHQRYDMTCPTCDGTGEKWCDFHKAAEQFE